MNTLLSLLPKVSLQGLPRDLFPELDLDMLSIAE